MKKLIILGIALLVLSVIPSSLTSSLVMAQTDDVGQIEAGSTCLYEGNQYSLGAYVRIELSATQSLVILCEQGADSDTPGWSSRTAAQVARYIYATE
jgi:hypothetical protein